MKKILIMAAAAMMAAVSTQAQDSEKKERRASLGINIGHRAADSLKVSALNVGVLTITDSLKGVQLSPISNVAEHASGLQMSAFSNVAYDGMKGFQLSALNNIVVGEANGLEIAGYTNQNVGTLKGMQVALRNETDTLRGLQLGIFNYITRDYQKGLQIGVVNLSVKDGWWLEGYREGAGWALTEKRTYQNQDYQDRLDAATIYSLLENEIIPLYYNKDKKGISKGWIKVIKNSIAQIAPHYTMKRQLDDYYSKFYEKLAKRFKQLSKDDNRLAKEIAQWKEAVAERWDAISVVSAESTAPASGLHLTGEDYTLRYVINEQGLDDAVALEKVNVATDANGEDHVFSVEPLKMVKQEGNNYTFEAVHSPKQAGQYKSAVRMYPKNKNLPHRQDFCYVKWLELPYAG